MHVGLAAKAWEVPTVTVAVAGLTRTVASVGTIWTVTPELWTVLPLSVAFTKRVSTPAPEPAVKVTLLPVVAERFPLAFVFDQAKVVPGGQGPVEHVALALKVAVPPGATVAEGGATATEVKSGPFGEMMESVPPGRLEA